MGTKNNPGPAPSEQAYQHPSEQAYRRGVHQGVARVAELLREGASLDDIERLESILRDLRSSTKTHALLLDDAVELLHHSTPSSHSGQMQPRPFGMHTVMCCMKFISGGGVFPVPVAPGEVAALIERRFWGEFRPQRATREPGIRYEAFKVRSIMIGADEQWHESPAEDLFTAFKAPMDPVFGGLNVRIEVQNVSDEPQPFMVTLEGPSLR